MTILATLFRGNILTFSHQTYRGLTAKNLTETEYCSQTSYTVHIDNVSHAFV